MYRVRKFTPTDTPHVTALLAGLSNNYAGAKVWLRNKLAEVDNQTTVAHCATISGAIVGVVIATHKGEGKWKMNTIFVSPDFRHAGVGDALMSATMRCIQATSAYVTLPAHVQKEMNSLLVNHKFTPIAYLPNRYGVGRDEVVYAFGPLVGSGE